MRCRPARCRPVRSPTTRCGDAPALVVATAIFQRTGRKYGDRSYRYVLADLGHALENLRVTAGALGVGTRFVAAFDEARRRGRWGWTRRRKGCWRWLRWVRQRRQRRSRAHQGGGRHLRKGSRRLPPLRAASGAALGVTAAVHAATSLRVASAPSPASAATPVHRPLVQALAALPPRCAGRAGLVGG